MANPRLAAALESPSTSSALASSVLGPESDEWVKQWMQINARGQLRRQTLHAYVHAILVQI